MAYITRNRIAEVSVAEAEFTSPFVLSRFCFVRLSRIPKSGGLDTANGPLFQQKKIT
jgi:hypothetical protein